MDYLHRPPDALTFEEAQEDGQTPQYNCQLPEKETRGATPHPARCKQQKALPVIIQRIAIDTLGDLFIAQYSLWANMCLDRLHDLGRILEERD
jgi:hypothetical protein